MGKAGGRTVLQNVLTPFREEPAYKSSSRKHSFGLYACSATVERSNPSDEGEFAAGNGQVQ